MSKKRVILLVIMCFFLFNIILPSSIAAEEGPIESVFKIIMEFFSFIPEKLTPESISAGGVGEFYARFILWILVFSVLYFAASNIPGLKDAGRGVQITIPLVLAIISVVLIPRSIILNIFITYSVVGALFVWALPLIGLWYLNSQIFTGEHSWHYLARALIFIIALSMFAYIYKTLPTWDEARPLTESRYWAWGSMLIGFMAIGALWSFWKFGSSMRGAGASAAGDYTPQTFQETERDLGREQEREYEEDTAEEQLDRAEDATDQRLNANQETIDRLNQLEQANAENLRRIEDYEEQLRQKDELGRQMLESAQRENDAQREQQARAYQAQIDGLFSRADQMMEQYAANLEETKEEKARLSEENEELLKRKQLIEKRNLQLEKDKLKRDQAEKQRVMEAAKRAASAGNKRAAAKLREEGKGLKKEERGEKKEKRTTRRVRKGVRKERKAVRGEIKLEKKDIGDVKELLRLIQKNRGLMAQRRQRKPEQYRKANEKDTRANSKKIRELIKNIYKDETKEKMTHENFKKWDAEIRALQRQRKSYQQKVNILHGQLFAKAKKGG